MQRKAGQYQVVDEKGNTLNMIDPFHKPTIWDPNSVFMQELELYKLKSEIKPRKVDMMRAQVGMIKDTCADPSVPKIYIPGKGGTF